MHVWQWKTRDFLHKRNSKQLLPYSRNSQNLPINCIKPHFSSSSCLDFPIIRLNDPRNSHYCVPENIGVLRASSDVQSPPFTELDRSVRAYVDHPLFPESLPSNLPRRLPDKLSLLPRNLRWAWPLRAGDLRYRIRLRFRSLLDLPLLLVASGQELSLSAHGPATGPIGGRRGLWFWQGSETPRCPPHDVIQSRVAVNGPAPTCAPRVPVSEFEGSELVQSHQLGSLVWESLVTSWDYTPKAYDKFYRR